MSFSLFLSKFRSLTPVLVVASSVLITIKLLTTQTPLLDNSLNVDLEEDIKTVFYKDEIVIPPEEKQEEPEEEKAQETSEEEQGDVPVEEGNESDNEENSKSESEEKEEKKQDKNEEKPKSRMFKEGDKMGILLKKLLTPSKK